MRPGVYAGAVKAAQAILGAVRPDLIIDGRWGTFTDSVYTSAPDGVKRAIDAAVAAFETDVQKLREYRKVVVARGAGTWIADSEVDALITRSAAQLGIPEHTEALKAFVRLEARRKTVDGVEYFDARSINGSSRGLMQIQPAAWADAAKVVTLPAYDKVWDPATNVLAGVAYAKFNLNNAKRLGVRVPINAETLYLMHNQGLGYFSKGIVTAREKQSSKVQSMIDKWYRRGGWR